MWLKTILFFTVLSLGSTAGFPENAHATGEAKKPASACTAAEDRDCILNAWEKTADKIDDEKWRDISYRELAKTLAADNKLDVAQSIIGKIKNPDTQALAIRGIGYAAAYNKLTDEAYTDLFSDLSVIARNIAHIPSQEIAFTYIAMSQALAGQNEAAYKTAAAMTNQSLRNKAYGEIGEIYANKGDITGALLSESKIDSDAYRNKSQLILAKIFANKNMFNEALQMTSEITNPVLKAEGYQFILTKQKPPATGEDKPHD